jgi:hypothetical protein
MTFMPIRILVAERLCKPLAPHAAPNDLTTIVATPLAPSWSCSYLSSFLRQTSLAPGTTLPSTIVPDVLALGGLAFADLPPELIGQWCRAVVEERGQPTYPKQLCARDLWSFRHRPDRRIAGVVTSTDERRECPGHRPSIRLEVRPA